MTQKSTPGTTRMGTMSQLVLAMKYASGLRVRNGQHDGRDRYDGSRPLVAVSDRYHTGSHTPRPARQAGSRQEAAAEVVTCRLAWWLVAASLHGPHELA